MSRYTSELTLTHHPKKWRLWRLNEELHYEAGVEGSGIWIKVPKDFVTDGASIPQFLWGILPSMGKYLNAAVVHDYLCRLIAQGNPHPAAPTRKLADKEFVNAMIPLGVVWWQRLALYVGVRIGAAFGIGGQEPEQ